MPEALAVLRDLFGNPEFQVNIGGDPRKVVALWDRARAVLAGSTTPSEARKAAAKRGFLLARAMLERDIGIIDLTDEEIEGIVEIMLEAADGANDE